MLMTLPIHPKTGGAAIGGTAGVLLTAILAAAGVHIPIDLAGAISAFLSAALAYVTPSPPTAATAASGPQDASETANRQVAPGELGP